MDHAHSHAQAASPSKHDERRRFYSTKSFRLLCMLSLTFAYFVVELVVGNITNSLALVADAFHMLSDFIALLIALVAVRIAKRRSDINTYGWVRAEVVGANINTVFLLALCLTIVFDAIKRYIEPEPIEKVDLLLIVGSVGLGINIIGLFLFQGFHGHTHGGGSHGHSHEKNKASKFVEKTRDKINDGRRKQESVFVMRPENQHDNQNTAAANEDDIESIENMPGPGEFKRHSIRALEEVVMDCASHSHGHSHADALPVDSNSPAAASADNSSKKKAKAASMNMHGVFLHVLADALGSVVVIISALLIKFVPHDPNDRKHWTNYIDPTLSVIIVIIITASALPLFKETSFVLLQTLPKHIEVNDFKKQLLDEVPQVDDIHELHIWRLTGEKFVASAHIKRRSLADYMSVAEKVKHFFHTMGIHSTTIQYEYVRDDTHALSSNDGTGNRATSEMSNGCLLRCRSNACSTLACCVESPTHFSGPADPHSDGNGTSEPTIVSAHSSIELNDEHNHEGACNHRHHAHTPASMDGPSTMQKF